MKTIETKILIISIDVLFCSTNLNVSYKVKGKLTNTRQDSCQRKNDARTCVKEKKYVTELPYFLIFNLKNEKSSFHRAVGFDCLEHFYRPKANKNCQNV